LRKTLAVLTSLALAASLAGCSSIDSEEAMFATLKAACGDAVAETDSGSPVKDVKVTVGGDEAKVEFTTPMQATSTTKSDTAVIAAGTGPAVTGNQVVEVEYLGINATTGEIFQPSALDGSGATGQMLKPGEDPLFCEALGGVREGSRVAVLYPAEVIHGGAGIDQLKIGKTDDVLFVFDVRTVYLPFAVGNERPAQTGFPTIIRSVEGVPGVSIPTDSPFPKASKDGAETTAIEVLIEGAGETVKLGDEVLLHYTGYTWADGANFDSSWTSGQPASFVIKEPGLITGFVQAVAGQKVGSQIVAVIPPALGYGSEAMSTIPANSTLVFVIDILGIKGK
jgi:peptidylprolyl isomerase